MGARRMGLSGVVRFVGASGGRASVQKCGIRVGGGGVEGLGSGGLKTLAKGLVGENVPPRQRGSYQGYLAANIVAGSTIGPVMGGFLTQAGGWQSVFLAYLPVGLVAVVLLARLPPGVRGSRRATRGAPRRRRPRRARAAACLRHGSRDRLPVDRAPRRASHGRARRDGPPHRIERCAATSHRLRQNPRREAPTRAHR